MKSFRSPLLALAGFLSLGAPHTRAQEAPPDPQMKAVLDELAALKGKPIETLTPEEARKQPTPADAVKALMKKQDKKGPEKVGDVDDITISISSGKLDARVYTPEGDGPFPVILYIHGGGWVIADLDVYDSTPRALCNAAKAVVISTHYRQAPEHKFPAAHEDVYSVYKWVLANATKYKGDDKKVALVGESAGANLAIGISLKAKDEGIQLPVHQVLVYPVASNDLDTPSESENAHAKPLNRAMMKWFVEHTFAKPEDSESRLISLVKSADVSGLPPTTVITAQIDPLRSDGEALAKKLESADVAVTYKNFDGVTHEFFGMGAVVDKAKEAVQLAADNLQASFKGAPAATVK